MIAAPGVMMIHILHTHQRQLHRVCDAFFFFFIYHSSLSCTQEAPGATVLHPATILRTWTFCRAFHLVCCFSLSLSVLYRFIISQSRRSSSSLSSFFHQRKKSNCLVVKNPQPTSVCLDFLPLNATSIHHPQSRRSSSMSSF